MLADSLRLQCFAVSRGRVRRRRGSEPRAARSGTPTPPISWRGPGRPPSWPNRTDPGGSRGLDDYFTRDFAQQHRRRDHGPQQVRPAARTVGGRGLEGLVGRRPAVPHARVRAHAPPAAVVHAVRHDVPFHRRRTGRGAAAGAGRPPTARTCASAAASPPSASSSTPTSSTRCTSRSRRIELGRGERLWKSHEELLDRFHLDTVPSPSGVTHLLFWRR